jgi:hypothetical protein
VETDASDFALGGTLSQTTEDKKLHPNAFHSRKFSPAEINYEIHDTELLAIVDCFKAWRRYLEGSLHTVQVFSDHKNLEYFMTTKVLNRRQARWAQELAGVDFKMFYRKGTSNGKPDVLLRRPEYRPEKGGGGDQLIQTILNEKHFGTISAISTGGEGTVFCCSAVQLAYLATSVSKWTKEFEQEIRNAGQQDTAYYQALEDLSRSTQRIEGKEKILELQDGLLYHKGLLWVSKNARNAILHTEHNSPVAGCFGQDKTIELIRCNFWWPKMDQEIIEYVRSCLECQKDKAIRHKPYGLLSPLELPYAPWTSIAMDCITDLPLSEDCDQLWVIVDRFPKMAHFIPLKKEQKTAEHLVRIFAHEIWRFHSIPTDIISGRDFHITSTEWKQFLGILGVRPRMSTSFHPQIDGQTERINQTIEAYLQSFINYEMDNWVGLLPMAEFAYNNSITQATGMSPFFANYGQHPGCTNPSTSPMSDDTPEGYINHLVSVQALVTRNLKATEEWMKKYADLKRKDAPEYKIGDLVMLDRRQIQTRRPKDKLDHKKYGPFAIEKVVSPTAMRLSLPRKWKIHNTLHVSLLEPYNNGTRPPPYLLKIIDESVDIEGNEEWEIEEMLSSRKVNGKVLYGVKWKGYPLKKDHTKEPYESLIVGGLE